jgi:hypothetical protein
MRLRLVANRSCFFFRRVLRSPACLYPQAFPRCRRDAPTRSCPVRLRRLRSPLTPAHSFDEARPLCLCLPLFGAGAGCTTKRTLIRVLSSRLSPAFIGSDFLATTGRSAISPPVASAFPSGLYLPCLTAFAARRRRDFPQSSSHSVPSILTLITSMSLAGHTPFLFSCKIRQYAKVSPFLRRVTQHLRHLWFTYCSGLDFACRPFGFPSRVTPCQSSSIEGGTSTSATAL